MLFNNPDGENEVDVIPVWSVTGVVKLALKEICNRYDVAVDDAFQFNAVFTAMFAALSTGDNNKGAWGGAGIVVKLQTADQPLVPNPLEAFTRQ